MSATARNRSSWLSQNYDKLILVVILVGLLLSAFLLFMQIGGQTIKSVCRYQQYRAVNKAIARLRTGQTRLQHGEHDQRGGIVWHTQGSGKSLTMVFLVRKMRADMQLRKFKVIVVTDGAGLPRYAYACRSGSNVNPSVLSIISRPAPEPVRPAPWS